MNYSKQSRIKKLPFPQAIKQETASDKVKKIEQSK